MLCVIDFWGGQNESMQCSAIVTPESSPTDYFSGVKMCGFINDCFK